MDTDSGWFGFLFIGVHLRASAVAFSCQQWRRYV
jgi:hypothetical protein